MKNNVEERHEKEVKKNLESQRFRDDMAELERLIKKNALEKVQKHNNEQLVLY